MLKTVLEECTAILMLILLEIVTSFVAHVYIIRLDGIFHHVNSKNI